MGIETIWVDDQTVAGTAAVSPGLLGIDGAAGGVGSLIPIVDIVAGTCARRWADGDWLTTSDVWIHECVPIAVAMQEAEPALKTTAQLMRRGGRSMVVACEVTIGLIRVATATLEFTRIRREASSHSVVGIEREGQSTKLGDGPALGQPLVDACGIVLLDNAAGVASLPHSPFVSNSIGTLQGGTLGLLVSVAAGAMVGEGARAVDVHYRFLAQTGDGPAQTVGTIIRAESGAATIGISVTDVSRDGLLVGHAVVRVESN